MSTAMPDDHTSTGAAETSDAADGPLTTGAGTAHSDVVAPEPADALGDGPLFGPGPQGLDEGHDQVEGSPVYDAAASAYELPTPEVSAVPPAAPAGPAARPTSVDGASGRTLAAVAGSSLAAGLVTGLLARQLLRKSAAAAAKGRGEDGRWRTVTVLATEDQVQPGGRPPGPLALLGDLVEVRVQPAPGDKGTELSARLRAGEPSGAAAALKRARGNDPRQQVRSALRESKQLIEVGEILRVDPTPHGTRKPGGALVGFGTKLAGGEGVL